MPFWTYILQRGGLYIFAFVAGVGVAFLHEPMSALVSFIFALVAVVGVAFCTLAGVGVGIFYYPFIAFTAFVLEPVSALVSFNIFIFLCHRRTIQHLVRCRPHIFANIVHSNGKVITPLVFIFGAIGQVFLKLLWCCRRPIGLFFCFLY